MGRRLPNMVLIPRTPQECEPRGRAALAAKRMRSRQPRRPAGMLGMVFFFFFSPKGLFPWGQGGEGGAWDAWPRSEQLVPVPPAPIPTQHY